MPDVNTPGQQYPFPTDLCAVSDVIAWLADAGNNDTTNMILSRLITATSLDFVTECGRHDIYPAADYVDAVVGDGTTDLVLRHWPINTIASVTVDGDEVPASPDGVQPGYIITDENGDPELHFRIRLIGSVFTRPPGSMCDGSSQSPGERYYDSMLPLGSLPIVPPAPNVVVSYNAGYTVIPPDIEQAVIDWVCYRYRSRAFIGQTSKHMGQGETVSFQQVEMPPNTARVIARYRRGGDLLI